jgi:hypothetical protein
LQTQGDFVGKSWSIYIEQGREVQDTFSGYRGIRRFAAEVTSYEVKKARRAHVTAFVIFMQAILVKQQAQTTGMK